MPYWPSLGGGLRRGLLRDRGWPPGEYWTIDAQGHRGHIQCKLGPGHVLMHPHPAVIEVSFAVIRGSSLVMRSQVAESESPIPYFSVLGVCMGNEESRVVEHT